VDARGDRTRGSEPDHHPRLTLRRRLIVFEGPEGAGKSTQLHRLARWLEQRGAPVSVLREPGGTGLGDGIRRILLDPSSDIDERAEALLFMASRAQLVAREIRPRLDRGDIVLLDRFFLSTYAYQVAGRGLDAGLVRAANLLATGGLVPDLTLLLLLSPERGFARVEARGSHDRMELAETDFHQRVAEAFARYAGEEWQRQNPECGRVVPIDAGRGEDVVFESIVSIVAAAWPESSALGSL
jgi:dTMP kinase